MGIVIINLKDEYCDSCPLYSFESQTCPLFGSIKQKSNKDEYGKIYYYPHGVRPRKCINTKSIEIRGVK